jgi:hypothetical protein
VIPVLALLFLVFGEIGTVKSEPDLERRSELALANADKAIDAAKQAYTAGDDKAEADALGEVRESVDVSYDALEHTNKAPRKSKYYKSAELKLRALLRRLNSLRDQVGFESRDAVDAVIKRVETVHDDLLAAIMSKKK